MIDRLAVGAARVAVGAASDEAVDVGLVRVDEAEDLAMRTTESRACGHAPCRTPPPAQKARSRSLIL